MSQETGQSGRSLQAGREAPHIQRPGRNSEQLVYEVIGSEWGEGFKKVGSYQIMQGFSDHRKEGVWSLN